MTVQVKVHPATLDQHDEFSGLAFLHHQLPLGRLAGSQREGDLITPFFGGLGCDFFGMGGPDEDAEDVVHQAGLLLGHKRALLFQCLDTVRFGLCGKLALDLAHFGQTEHAADPGGVDVVFRGQHHGHKDRDSTGRCNGGGADELRGGGQFVEAWFFCVEHVVLLFTYAATK